ncbi:redoxin domain-containing protein [Nocardiopsis sp. FR4]|uniref:redoxin domain-containing protein n=1 Tax=Nocardiopsis sp. FR4 TaxID=2605985 RepID=UPI00135C3793|nr:redoxin domain-containing protein [Nocardiopsis sp. FR4]
MRFPPRPILATASAALLALTACGSPDSGGDAGGGAASEGADSAAGGQRAASALDFQAQTLDGQEVTGSSLQGEPVVLWFWAPWCTVCRAEAGGVAEAAERHGDRVEFLGVAGRGEVEAMRAFVDETGTGQMRHLVDDDGSLWSGFGVASQPAFAFVRADGTHLTVSGTLTEDDLDEYVEAELLSADGPDS